MLFVNLRQNIETASTLQQADIGEQPLEAYFLIGKVAGRIFRPHVAMPGLGPSAEIATADVKEAAFGAPSADMGFFILQLGKHLNGRVVPYG